MGRRYWLLKSEPSTFSIHDLARAAKQTTCWDGVRNYQARNFLKAMGLGDQALFYHSNADPPAVVGIVEVVRTAYPDHTALDRNDPHYDPKSTAENPIWMMVDVRLVRIFDESLSLDRLRQERGLERMELLRKGSRLSVQPVREAEWKSILALAAKARMDS